ncbi:hypothetical protein ACKI2N_030245 [Cupriavidus sp. 30B13]|uniref:hypothetical protein n=1 Tax=Cupriavidus sp. 30B13 TaxID=3384241 RepID=UPI003B8F4B90
MYHHYKPLRNYLRKFGVGKSFEELWGFFQYLSHDGRAIPVSSQWQQLNFRRDIFPWELGILTREIILNAQNVGSASLHIYDDFAGAINRIRNLDERISGEHVSQDNILEHLHRIAHQQFPWQRRNAEAELLRYLKIFGENHVEQVIRNSTGLSMRDLYVMGLAIGGSLLRQAGINANQDFTRFGIPLSRTRDFLSRMRISLSDLKSKLKELQRFDDSWAYTWNPLEATPLVSVDPNNPHLLHCPIPPFMMRRFSAGIYYEVVNAVDFDNAFGSSFEKYVGDVLREIFLARRFEVVRPDSYLVGKDVHHGADWILSDKTAVLFIECKTKRLPVAGKYSINLDELGGQLAYLAAAIVQSYKNINDVIEGYSSWKPSGLPIYPLIVTLEDWYLFSPTVHSKLREQVEQRLKQAGLSESLVFTMPYSVTSIDEFERVGKIIARTDIDKLFSLKTQEKYQSWHFSGFTSEFFTSEHGSYKHLFRNEWDALLADFEANVFSDVSARGSALRAQRRRAE